MHRIALPWTSEAREVLEELWKTAIDAGHHLADLAVKNGVRRIALGILPPHLVYNVPTLLPLREAIGAVLGANVDPSHFFWPQSILSRWSTRSAPPFITFISRMSS
ncbi:MAG: hypothetical protein QOG05_2003 [Streptosporangiaceae bacterium]|jgi:sugar phosphate isomerase/epimerase|nr:hypothetical protein [Streptosporangiaceae bacterium]